MSEIQTKTNTAGNKAEASKDQPESPSEPLTWPQRLWLEWIKPVVPVILVLLAVRSSLADWNDVPTGSMKPTIMEGDRVYVNKIAYDIKIPFAMLFGWSGSIARIGEPRRGEIVVFFHPKEDTRMVKRIVGVPGDVIEIRDDVLYINGDEMTQEALDGEAFDWIRSDERWNSQFRDESLGDVNHTIMLNPRKSSGWFGPIELNEDEYFAMGDNRDNSRDSREWGVVGRDRIAGRASRVVVSLDIVDGWAPRWGRFFKALR